MRLALAAVLGACAVIAVAVWAGTMEKGKAIYEANCIRCHSKGAEGSADMAKKFKVAQASMDLTSQTVRDSDEKFLIAFITEGKGAMPAFKGKLTKEQIEDVLAYARSLRGRSLGFGTAAKGDIDAEVAAKRFVVNCAYCHGKDAKGNPGMAKVFKVEQHKMDLTSPEAQSLTDEDIAVVVTQGKGHMPAFGQTLSQEEIHALVSYVRSLRGVEKAAEKSDGKKSEGH
jgi:cbb3-type cytochrome c oxidase subunit III